MPHTDAIPLYRAKAELFRVLGHPVRIRVVELLCEGPHTVRQLLDDLAIAPANLSQQLAVLRRANIVMAYRENGHVTYALAGPDVRDLMMAARRFLREMISEQGTLLEALDADDAAAR